MSTADRYRRMVLELQHKHQELEETHRRLLDAQGQLVQSQKLEAIGQMAAGIAHEINTPLQYVGDNVDFLEEGFRDLTTLLESYDELLVAASQVPSLAGLTEKLEALRQQLDLDYYLEQIPRALEQTGYGLANVSEIVQAVKQFSHPGSRERKLGSVNKAILTTVLVSRHEWKCVAELVTDLAPDLPHVPLLAAEFNQALLNLIVNAAHSIADVVGDGASGKGTIRVSTRADDGHAEVRIEDSGAGVPEEIRERLFDPFFTTKESGRGSGQGLAIAHSVVVDRHGGEIFFESEPGHGCTFVMRLPLAPMETLIPAEESPVPEGASAGALG